MTPLPFLESALRGGAGPGAAPARLVAAIRREDNYQDGSSRFGSCQHWLKMSMTTTLLDSLRGSPKGENDLA